jgi:hypothetical protein
MVVERREPPDGPAGGGDGRASPLRGESLLCSLRPAQRADPILFHAPSVFQVNSYNRLALPKGPQRLTEGKTVNGAEDGQLRDNVAHSPPVAIISMHDHRAP